MTVTSFDVPLIKKEKNSSDAWNFYFRKPKNFSYLPGQYIKMKLEIKSPDSRGVTRYFTLSSSPIDEFLMITTRILKSTFKLRLGDVKIGEKVHMRGPWGDFLLDEKEKRHCVFIAGGIGMTPYHSIVRYISQKKIKTKITLFVSYKTSDQILFKEELEQIEKECKNIKIITTITEVDKSTWMGEIGRISPELLKKHLDSLEDNLYYIAGPDPMVESLKKMLLGQKVKESQVLEDGFPGY